MTKISKKFAKQAEKFASLGATVYVIIDINDHVIEVLTNETEAQEKNLGRVEKYDPEQFELVRRGRKLGYEAMDSKRQDVVELYINSPDKSRKAMLELWGKKLGMSEAMASTYYYYAKNNAENYEPQKCNVAKPKKWHFTFSALNPDVIFGTRV